MADFDITRKSRPVLVSSYRPSWADEFQRCAHLIRESTFPCATFGPFKVP